MKIKTLIIFLLLFPLAINAQNFDFKGEYGGNDLALVSQNGKYGFIDKENKIVVPCIYSNIYHGLYTDHKYFRWDSFIITLPVYKDKKWGGIDKNGKVVIPFIYNELLLTCYSYGSFAVKKDGKWGIIDKEGKVKIPFDYDDIQTDQTGTTCDDEYCFTLKKNEKWGVVDINEHIIIPFEYDYLDVIRFRYNKSSEEILAKKGEEYGIIKVKRKDSRIEASSFTVKKNNNRIAYFRTYDELKRIIATQDNSTENKDIKAILTYNSPLSTTSANYRINIGINSSSNISDVIVMEHGRDWQLNPSHIDGDNYSIQLDVYLENGDNPIKVEVKNAAGVSTETYNVHYEEATIPKPELTWDSQLKSEAQDFNLSIGVKSASAITDRKVYLNGTLSRGVSAVNNDGADFRITQTLSLIEGNNIIRAEVTNSGGTSIIEKNIVFTKPNVEPQNIVVNKNQRRQALVIGNSNYRGVNFSKLPNPENDAKAIAAKLRTLGFEVTEKVDLTMKEYARTVDDFTHKASGYDVSLFYYSGHAVEMDGINYLAPIDAVGEEPRDLKYECYNANEILSGLEKAESPVNIIVLDACRNNPKMKTRAYGMSRGLAQMNSPEGTFIMYSTSPGKTANDGTGRNSPFTEAFLTCLDKKGLVLELFAKEVTNIVKTKTNKTQTPWSSGSLDGYFYFNQ